MFRSKEMRVGKKVALFAAFCCLVLATLASCSSKQPGGNSLAAEAAAAANKEGGEQLERLESSIANARLRLSAADMVAAAGHQHGKSHGKYYMYAESPKKGAYKMGFKRGNHKHEIERKESGHKSHVHSYFKWHDKKGKGSHKFEFKHSEKKRGHY